MDLIRITPNKEKAKSIFKMSRTSGDMIATIDRKRFPSNILVEYYDVMRQLMTAILLLDGYKTKGEGAHRQLIEYLGANYREFSEYDVHLLEELRTLRNRIEYDGFFITGEYLERKMKDITDIISRLEKTVARRL